MVDLESCNDCSFQCSSVIGRLRKKGFQSIDALKRPQHFQDQSYIPMALSDRAQIYCISRGNIKLSYSNGSVIRICGQGDIIGYQDMVGRSPYMATAMGPVSACSFDKELFMMIQEKSPEIAKEFMMMLSRELALRDDRINYLENHSVRNKVAATLISLNKKFGVNSEFGSRINVPIDRKTLAQLSGTVVESLARTLTDFEKSQVIVRSGKHIHVQDLIKLQQLSIE